MGGRLPEFEELGPLSADEWDAVRSLVMTCLDMRQEWASSKALTDAVRVKAEVVEEYAGPVARYHADALAQVCHSAYVHEDNVGEVTWRYASAAAVVAMAVMDRLLLGRPPLDSAELDRLGGSEATLGQVRRAAGEPYAWLVAARDDPNGTGARIREELVAQLAALADELLEEEFHGRRLTPAEVDACLLTALSSGGDGTEPWWPDVLDPVVNFAETVVFAIAHWVRDQTTASADG